MTGDSAILCCGFSLARGRVHLRGFKFEYSWRLSRGEVNELFVMKARLNVVEVSSIVIKNEDRSRVKRGCLSFETRLALVCNEVWQG